ncbi:Uncharacterised protein [uncultured archaeon]|nr:Uncharacterised protein [uncultured archaeon]
MENKTKTKRSKEMPSGMQRVKESVYDPYNLLPAEWKTIRPEER